MEGTSRPESSGAPPRRGLLLSRDLIFTSKITGTAQALGTRILTAGSVAQALGLIERERPAVVLVDLAAGDLAAPENLKALIGQAGAGVPFVAFGSHVDTESLARAAECGCDPVMPRSKFTLQLPDLLRRYLLEAVPPGSSMTNS